MLDFGGKWGKKDVTGFLDSKGVLLSKVPF